VSDRKRRVVKLIAAAGSAMLEYEDGKTEHMVFNGSDVWLMEHAPSGGCQRCGHDHRNHGSWDYDGEDEYWHETKCDSCDCVKWIPFTPWRKQ
jgi:hypothetical protein